MTNLTKAHTIAYVNEKSRIIGEIFVDDVSELLEANGIDGYELVQGSVAYVITSGELYVMGGDGRWYNSDGGAVAETSNTDMVTVNNTEETESNDEFTENSEN